MENYISIAKFMYESEYQVLKLLLEQNNIRFYFKNETMISVLPFYSNALGGIILLVHPEDKEQAIEIVEDFSSHLQIVK